VHFEVTAGLGGGSETWNLTVTLPGQSARRFADLKNTRAPFEKLTWLGFISNATTQTTRKPPSTSTT